MALQDTRNSLKAYSLNDHEMKETLDESWHMLQLLKAYRPHKNGQYKSINLLSINGDDLGWNRF